MFLVLFLQLNMILKRFLAFNDFISTLNIVLEHENLALSGQLWHSSKCWMSGEQKVIHGTGPVAQCETIDIYGETLLSVL